MPHDLFPAYEDKRCALYHGSCIDVMQALLDAGAEGTIDAIVCDPPYHLTPPGKRGAATGFAGRTWDGGDVAHRAETWELALRLLKPGGHLVAFGGTRTYHRLAVAVEDAGFENRDMLAWSFGTGFPKSLNVSKALAKTSSPEAARWEGHGTALKPAIEPAVLARKPLVGTVAENVLMHGTGSLDIGACRVAAPGGRPRCVTVAPAGPEPGAVYGGAGLSGIRARADELSHLGRWPANLLHDGSDAVRAAFPEDGKRDRERSRVIPRSERPEGPMSYGLGDRIGEPAGVDYGDCGSAARFFQECPPAVEDAPPARADAPETAAALGRWPANLLHDGSDAVRAAFPEDGKRDTGRRDIVRLSERPDGPMGYGLGDRIGESAGVSYGDCGSAARFFQACPPSAEDAPPARADAPETAAALGRWPANLLHDGSDEVRAAFPDDGKAEGAPRVRVSGQAEPPRVFGAESRKPGAVSGAFPGGGGSAARFFQTCPPAVEDAPPEGGLHYCAKAPQRERAGSKHPTVKPISLMRYLVRLVCPAGGVVLDPFAGSGTTLEAALMEGRFVIGIELTEDYIPDIVARIARANAANAA